MREAKTDIPGVYKTSEGFLINKDNASLTAYKAKRVREYELDILRDDVISLKDDIKEIKELLKGLVK